jgi:hypothetical protein
MGQTFSSNLPDNMMYISFRIQFGGVDKPGKDHIPIDDSGGFRLTTTPPIGLSISVLQLLRVVTASSNSCKGNGLVNQAAIEVCFNKMRGKDEKNLHVWWTFKCQEVFGQES